MREPADSVQRVHERCKKKWRIESDIVATYNDATSPSERLTRAEKHERKFGLFLNCYRINFVKALPISLGVGAAFGGMSEEFIRALIENEFQVQEAMALAEREKADKNG
jgi:hypothetical protein